MQLLQSLKENFGNQSIPLLPDSNFSFNNYTCSLFREIRGYDKHKITVTNLKYIHQDKITIINLRKNKI